MLRTYAICVGTLTLKKCRKIKKFRENHEIVYFTWVSDATVSTNRIVLFISPILNLSFIMTPAKNKYYLNTE